MGIMDLLESLSGPEYDEPAPLPIADPQPPAETETAPQPEPAEAPAAEAESPAGEVQAEAPAPVEEAALEEEAAPEEEIAPEILPVLDAVYPQEPSAPKKRRIRPEVIMGIIAAFAAALLLVLVLLCRPYFTAATIPADEDPDDLPQRHQQNFEALQVTEKPKEESPEPDAETEPEETTIPPDPNPYDRYDFQYNRHNYLLLQNVKSYAGVDVSAYQGSIDWAAVKASGIDFAIIRLGYRGYESGKLVEDEYAVQNLEGARDAGLRVGAYFFSQALTISEVDEEIQFMLEILGERYLDMPIVLDWEIPAATARTRNMDARTLTDLQLHFCQVMDARGYMPMIYFNWHQSENLYYLSELEDYGFWLALYQDRMTYPWKVDMWQYTASGKVPGIYGAVDLNVYMPD